MEKGIRMKNFVLVLLLGFVLVGCGVDGPPKAPIHEKTK
jgi:predicted small lipoprotein YifL|tara:strand:+ start:18 stop:134 length:117 start_codon:yes stop_codon:yes gene_type:complete